MIGIGAAAVSEEDEADENRTEVVMARDFHRIRKARRRAIVNGFSVTAPPAKVQRMIREPRGPPAARGIVENLQ